MNKNPILLARTNFFFHLFSAPKFPPLLPTTYLPPPTYHLPTPPSFTPSPKLQRRRAGVSLELGLLEQELRATKAWSCWSKGTVAGVGAGPSWDPGKHLSSFLLLWSCVATHCKKKKKKGNGSNVAIAFFFFFLFCCAAALLEHCCSAMQQRRRRQQLPSPSSSYFTALQCCWSNARQLE